MSAGHDYAATAAPLLLVVAAVCAYEAAALVLGRFPTVTDLSRRYLLVRALVLGGLAYHFKRVVAQ